MRTLTRVAENILFAVAPLSQPEHWTWRAIAHITHLRFRLYRLHAYMWSEFGRKSPFRS